MMRMSATGIHLECAVLETTFARDGRGEWMFRTKYSMSIGWSFGRIGGTGDAENAPTLCYDDDRQIFGGKRGMAVCSLVDHVVLNCSHWDRIY